MKELWSKVVKNAGKVITVKRALIAGGVIVGLAMIDYIANELKESDELVEDENNIIDVLSEEVNIDSDI